MGQDRRESTILIIWGAAKLHADRSGLRDSLLNLLHQARFANAWFPTEQYHLAVACLRRHPALEDEAHFMGSPDQRGQFACADVYLQTALDAAFIQDAVDREWGGESLQDLGAQVLTGKETPH